MIDYDVSDRVCVLRLAAGPVNTITLDLLAELRHVIARAAGDADVDGIILTGTPAHFSAGADVSLFRDIVTGDDARRISRVFQEAFQAVEDSPKPTVAAVAGRMMGSAVELALACGARVCTPEARFSMPEVNLGINPGAGGTQRLSRAMGTAAALDMLLTGKTVRADEALQTGLVDAVCEPGDLIAEAKALLPLAAERPAAADRKDRISDPAALEDAFAQADKRLASVRPELVAPAGIVRAVRKGIEESVAAGMTAEQEVFAGCMATFATRNRIRLFFATREAAKAPDLADAEPREVRRAAVVGMGSMGAGIAQAMLIAGLPVVVLEAERAALDRGTQRIRRSFDKRVAAGKLAPDRADAMMALLTTTTSWDDLTGVDLAIEAVFEDAAVKQGVLKHLEDVCGDETVLASNTSTISLAELSAAMEHPERLVGLHFFNPAHTMPLLEVIRHDGSAPWALATGLAVAKKLRKTPVLVRNREGFLVNRLFIPYLKEAFWLLADGAEPADVDAAMVAFGFPMGPLTLIDMAGLDILVHTDDVLRRAFPRHGPMPSIVTDLVEAGHAGQKSGAGVYRYEKGDRTPHPHAAADALIACAREARGTSGASMAADEITRRLVLRMVCEALWVLEEGIVQRESDLDVAMVLGTGFPDFRGGVVQYAREIGLADVRAELDDLTTRHGERFAPCPLLTQTKGTP